ncbi:BA14K family protein [Bartonella krasnovii]|uniref:BA14K family protein n=1 Tax=Bartonella krasnovii TaxID=2267275 RepID=UPI001F4D18E8|nr:BA14K family protein [Bartonella krasnovii]UNF39290.1 BA14K family protein [Bartonella krasnovii]UNF42587.1 BA14K family protein [Bartonella krasnovii]UNF50832.1 BA14K family protein [Bartonella krasnovii]UNF55798.1 BA14K family protein [Bartonella krasnovii]
MKKIIELAVLSAITNVSIFMPLGTTLADTSWSYEEKTTTKKMKSIEEEIDDHMRRVNKEIDDRMNPMKRTINSHSSSHSSPHRRPLQRVAYTGSEHRHRHIERETYHYSKHNTTTHHRHTHKHYETRGSSGEALAAGILVFAAGVILNNLLKKPKQPQTQIIYQTPQHPQVTYQEAPRVIYQPVPHNQVIDEVQSTTYQPLQQSDTHNWLQYCKKKYRSFNPETGTFRGRDGREYICYAPLN